MGGDCNTILLNNPAVFGARITDKIQVAVIICLASLHITPPFIVYLQPAEDPNAVTLDGSPPNSAIFF